MRNHCKTELSVLISNRNTIRTNNGIHQYVKPGAQNPLSMLNQPYELIQAYTPYSNNRNFVLYKITSCGGSIYLRLYGERKHAAAISWTTLLAEKDLL